MRIAFQKKKKMQIFAINSILKMFKGQIVGIIAKKKLCIAYN